MKEIKQQKGLFGSFGTYLKIIAEHPLQYLLGYFLFILVPIGAVFMLYYSFHTQIIETYIIFAAMQMFLVFYFYEVSGMTGKLVSGKTHMPFAGYRRNTSAILLIAVLTFAVSLVLQIIHTLLVWLIPDSLIPEMGLIVVTIFYFLIVPVVLFELHGKNSIGSGFTAAFRIVRNQLGKTMLLIFLIIVISVAGTFLVIDGVYRTWPDAGDEMVSVISSLSLHVFGALMYPITLVMYVGSKPLKKESV